MKPILTSRFSGGLRSSAIACSAPIGSTLAMAALAALRPILRMNSRRTASRGNSDLMNEASRRLPTYSSIDGGAVRGEDAPDGAPRSAPNPAAGLWLLLQSGADPAPPPCCLPQAQCIISGTSGSYGSCSFIVASPVVIDQAGPGPATRRPLRPVFTGLPA